ncbi:Nonribosomal peptide synthetase [Hyphodiscus hymeniophilus]|uniref:Nonribosomal peptide synthetase n=1 Tax=Hyphodiscus hymeniophilus TaxID=353542 RepID=A0A9P7AWU1_9HELO|nr:Nonribosomal peptide synthetase [Hyphodiscus hymeniophilus]
MESSMLFWTRLLRDPPAESFPRLPSPTYRPVGNSTYEHQVSLAQEPRSPYSDATIIQATWTILMGLYSNTYDVVVGITQQGRNPSPPGVEDEARPTLVKVPFRTQFRRDQLVHDLLSSIEGQHEATKALQQLSITEIAKISPDAKAACDFRTLLVLQSPGERSARDDTLLLDHGLILECELTSGSSSSTKIRIKATYDALLLKEIQVERILMQFENILQRLCVAAPSLHISDLQSSSPADLKQVFSWNAAIPETSAHCVHDLIKSRVAMNQDHSAICSWDGSLSYGEVDDLSSQLASHLVAHGGVGPEILVPVCFEKSKWAVVAMIAVLKAGGACVPLSPAHPISRLEGIIEDLGQACASVVLVSALSQRLFKETKPTIVVDSSLFGTLRIDSISVVPIPTSIQVAPHNVAFIITTSGSTGKPKEIVLEHAAICTSARDHGKMTKLGPHSRVLQFAAYTFDISLSDIFVTLIHGGTVCIPSEHDRMNNLVGAIENLNANHMSITASVVSHLSPQDLKRLKTLIVAGEAITRDVVDKWAEHVTLINMYGPAECSIYCIGQPDIQASNDASIIGKGVGSRVWITNEEDPNILTPIGTVGEILIEGPVLARKYLNDEDGRTKSAFILDPTWTQQNEPNKASPRRFYHDGQIKLRGQRIEPGEVEYQIRKCLQKIAKSVVSLIKVNGQAKLAAFMEIGPDEDPETNANVNLAIANSPAQLEAFRDMTRGLEKSLHSVLPGYMVPSLFIPITRIPLSLSGKADRKRLRDLVANLSIDQLSGFQQDELAVSPPSTVMEQRLASLWEKLLKVAGVGKNDNFFQRGGDSIGAMRLVAAARRDRLSITVDAIFKNPVLSQMALKLLEDVKEVSGVAPFSLLKAAEVEDICHQAISQCKTTKEEIQDIYPCTPQQIYWIDGGNTREHQAQIVYDIPASLDVDRLRNAWNAVTEAHDVLRTRIIRTPAGTFNVVLRTGLDWRNESSLEAYLEEDREAIMSLGDRLQRFCIIKDDYLGREFFVFTAQHSSYDAWSLYLLMKDRDHAYHHGASAANTPNFSSYIKPVIQDAYRDVAREFWRSHMAGTKSKPLVVVPEGHQTFADSMLKRDFKLSKRQESSVTTSTMIEVAWAIVYSRAINEEDVVLDILRHGRNAPLPGVMDLTAPTITAIPFVVHVKPEETAQSLLQRSQDQLNTIDSYEHFGFANVAKLNQEAALACKNSLRIHILPPLSELQKDVGIEKGIDLTTRWVELCFNLPLRVDCVVTSDGIGLEANFDKELVSPDQVNTYFDQFQNLMTQLAAADPKQTVEKLKLSGTPESTSVLMESIAAKSAGVKKFMLTPQLPSSKPLTGSFVIGRW